MNLKLLSSAVVGALALTAAGAASAQTALNATSGDLFLNIVDTTNSTSLVVDTGISQASFSSTGSYSIPLTGNANYQAFIANTGDSYNYSVISGAVASGTYSVLFTGNSSPNTATVIDNRSEEALVTDGPFIESKEYLGGFWVIEAPDLDVALELAADGSKACNRRVEVRPFL